jgi:peptide chain release factor 1
MSTALGSFQKLEEVLQHFQEIESKLADPTIAGQSDLFRKLSQERASLLEIVAQYTLYKKCCEDLASAKLLIEEESGPEASDLIQLAHEEIKTLVEQKTAFERDLRILLLPQDPNDQKNIILEIRAGAGGDEASLFAGELFRMYQRYAERQSWRVELLSASATGLGGFKEIICSITGQRVFSRLKWEAGVHRVQRIPETEAQGRVHTSTVTVAVLPEAEEVDVQLNPNDLRIDVFRSGGAGGQSVNTTDSAVRITHIPSGLVVSCQDERSQHKNKDRALKILRSRLYEQELERAQSSHAAARRSQVGTADRSERIRTYNFPQGRLTDHRIGFTLYQLPEVMEGKIDELIARLIAHYQMLALQENGLS